jgi:CTD nuclear envelope phosphatase 1
VIIFTASVRQYGDPVINMLDPTGLVKERLFRSSCVNQRGNFVKDLAVLNRDLSQVIIVDNSPVAYTFNPRTPAPAFSFFFFLLALTQVSARTRTENAVPISNWMGTDPGDEELLNLLPFLDALRWTQDVRSILSLRISR